MNDAATRRHKQHCKTLSAEELQKLVRNLDPEIRKASSLLACARRELRNRARGPRKPSGPTA